MSLLTGSPRTATVSALGDCSVLEIQAEAFRAIGNRHPVVVEQIGLAAMTRRQELEQARAAAGGPAPAIEASAFVQRV
jgi:CRP-like cAMP-binding protein